MPKKTPRYYQTEAKDALMVAIRKALSEKRSGKFVIDAAPATGKSLIIAMAAEHVASRGGNVLCLSYQPILCGQNYDECWENETAAAMYAAKFNRKQVNSNVVYATTGTIVNALHTDFKKRVFDLILIDESHQTPYEEENSAYMKIISHFYKTAKDVGKLLQIGGFTGSPYRGTESIIGKFWDEIVYNIGIEKATEEGFLTPPVYGFADDDDNEYSFDGVDTLPKSWEFSEEQLDEIVMNEEGKKRLVRILAEVKAKTMDRNQIIIFASTQRHAREVRRVLIALGEVESSIGLILSDKEEGDDTFDEVVSKSKGGKIKWLVNVSCLTTGFDSPLIDVVLFLRPVGSLTLLIQCLGRAARLLKPEHEEKGINKPNYLVLDYAGVFDRLGHLLDNPIINDAELEKAKKDKTLIRCPHCHAENSETARRCIAKVDELHPDYGESYDGRCSHFWKSIQCPKCEAHNDITAQVCRNPECKHELIDPNKKLLNKSYSDDEMVKVKRMTVEPSRNGAIRVTYELAQPAEHGNPYEIYFGLHKEASRRIWQAKFVNVHVDSWGWRNKIMALKNPEQIMTMKKLFKQPSHIAYRINEKNKFVIGRKRFEESGQ